jgi:redox-sensitive bicupin YhaK (pirin superfamily)
MTLVSTKSPPRRSARAIVQRTRGRAQGFATRLMSPSDFGEILKPFVFLDLFDHEGAPFTAGLHPHSGIATLTYIAEGSVSYVDPDNVKGTVVKGGVEWMLAGRGMWHGGGLDKAGRTRGFQLWIALPPELELGPATSVYLAPEDVPEEGPARVLLGSYGSASSPIASPAPINYLAVRLRAGERWRYKPPTSHSVLWAAIASGTVSVPGELGRGELAAFEPSSKAVEFEARTDTEFVLGSAVPHKHDLVLGSHSVHTTPAALRDAQAHISAIRTRLVQEGRL